jgi:hypothetical protein
MNAPDRVLPVFSNPSTWCDARCERCPLFGECSAGRDASERARAAPVDDLLDDMKSLVAQLRASLHRGSFERPRAPRHTLYTLEEPRVGSRARRPDDAGPRPISLAAARIDRAAVHYAAALRAVERERFFGPIPAFGDATLIVDKIHDLLAVDSGDDAWDGSAVPVLLLVERLLGQAASVLQALPRSAASAAAVRAGSDLRRALAPWMSKIRDGHRSTLDGLVLRRRAPSPFCVDGRRRPSGVTAG